MAGRPPLGPAAHHTQINVKVNTTELTVIDTRRGSLTRSAYLRSLLNSAERTHETAQRGSPSPRVTDRDSDQPGKEHTWKSTPNGNVCSQCGQSQRLGDRWCG